MTETDPISRLEDQIQQVNERLDMMDDNISELRNEINGMGNRFRSETDNIETRLRDEIRASGRRTRRFMTVAFTVFTIVVSAINAIIELLL